MALDSGYLLAAQALPTPTDTLYESPIVGVAKRSSRQGPPSTFSNYSSAPFPPNEDSYFARQHGPTDEGNEDRFSTNDARRLSPNLGLSLVSQIHTLNKQLEDKRTIVDSLEDSLHHTRADNEQLTVDLNAQRIEVRSVKKQMQSLENDMLKALEDIATERDNAIESIADTRRRLEVSTKKIRVQEEDVNRTHILWEKDKQDWDDKKRELEGRIHTAEERLKTMVEEMLVVQNTSQTRPGTGAEVDECVRDTCFIRGNDASSIRAPSRLSNRSTDDINMGNETLNFRSSRMSGLHELGGSKMSGLSLAEELDISENDDSDNDVQDESEDRGIGSLGALPEETSMLSRHYSDDKKAKKAMEFHADSNKQLFGDDSSAQHMVIINDYINFPAKQLASQYTDTATQCSPHLSPTLREAVDDVSEKPAEQTERTANQSRKRAAMPQIAVEQASNANKGGIQRLRMASTACQTMPQSSSFIAKVTNDALASVSKAPNEMKSSSTQTTDDATMISRSATSRPSPSPMDVPVIAIHPPASRPSSSHTSVVLPPRTRNAACQVVIVKPTSTRSTSMQTEEIRVDRRRVRVPPRLQSPNVTAQFLSQQTECLGESAQTTGPEAVKRTFPSPPPIEAGWTLPRSQAATGEEAYRGKNDNGPLTNKQPSGPRRPIRSESIFAGFADVSDNDTEKAPNDYSDDEFLNAAPIRKTLSKVQNSWKLVPQSKGSVLERLELASEEVEAQEPAGEPPKITRPKDIPQTTSKTFQTKAPKVSQRTSNTTKPTDNRRGAFVANGIHKGKGPTVPNGSKKEAVAVAPPFPVPTRFSSRNIPLSASDGAASPSPYVTNFFSARPSQGRTRPTAKRQTIRKVQSAAAVSTSSGPRRSQPVSSMSAASTVPGSPKSPGLGQNQFILPYESVAKLPSQSTPSRSGAGEASIEPPCEQTSVVDAIAQTMVGEWMWKYVRKRTSFGITDNPQAEFEMGRTGENGSSSSVRHKRWVWLAPFERAVIWNSKQPTSGPALLGKGGRKRKLRAQCARLLLNSYASYNSISP